MIHLQQDFKEFLKSLSDNSVEYLLVGGYAVGYYGYIRATADLDIWVNQSDSNSKKLVKALREFGFGENINIEMFLKDNNIVRMGVPPFRIEIMTSISGVSFDVCYRNRNQIDCDGQQIDVICLDDLKKNKKASGRFKDLSDLEYLP